MLSVTIVSPEKTLYQGEAVGVKLPGTQGRFEVLDGHAPLISTLTKGTIECVGDSPYKIDVSSGFVEVAHNEVSVCVEI